jgi:hypothetical protein
MKSFIYHFNKGKEMDEVYSFIPLYFMTNDYRISLQLNLLCIINNCFIPLIFPLLIFQFPLQ